MCRAHLNHPAVFVHMDTTDAHISSGSTDRTDRAEEEHTRYDSTTRVHSSTFRYLETSDANNVETLHHAFLFPSEEKYKRETWRRAFFILSPNQNEMNSV